MTKVALRAYDHEIESMIEQGQRLDEAVAHCRHILATYPKHLNTYRLLGKAYLEAKRYDEAVDIFQRVLVAAPDDFVSHVGMSIIADDQGKLDESIWHMERAFEVQPSNAAIQSELQRLFGRRDGVEPPKIRLTRGALAQMYVQGDLYSQAISEIHAVLANDPDRMDMQVLLAKAYARNGQKAEAADACSALLAVSPYCLDANRLMAEILPGTESSQAADEYRGRVVELDPYAAHATSSLFESESVADAAVTLQRLEYTGSTTESAPGLGLGGSPRTTPQAAAVPSWLSAGPAAATATTAPVPPNEDLPEFLRGSGWREVPATSERDVTEPAFDAGGEPEPEAVPGALPDWVRSLAPADSDEVAGPGSAESQRDAGSWQPVELPGEEPAGRIDNGAPDDTPDWLRELAGSDLSSDNVSGGRIEGADLGRHQGTVMTVPAADDGGLAWLEGLAEKHGAKAEELTTSPEMRAEDPPDWIANLRKDDEMAPERWDTQPTEGGEAEGSSTGLAQHEKASTSRPASSMDWLSELAEPDAFAGMERSGEGAQATLSAESAPNASLGSTADDSLPDWLMDKPAVPMPPNAPARLESPGPRDADVELPSWLADFDGKPESSVGEEPSGPAPQAPAIQSSTGDSPSGVSEWPTSGTVQARTQVPDSAWPAPERQQLQPATPEMSQPPPVIRDALPARVRPTALAPALDATWLASAQAELARGNIAAAMDMYGRLIRRGRGLAEIIRELREALYRFPVEVPIWQALGDAYMRANSLQEALDAYTKAEELLR